MHGCTRIHPFLILTQASSAATVTSPSWRAKSTKMDIFNERGEEKGAFRRRKTERKDYHTVCFASLITHIGSHTVANNIMLMKILGKLTNSSRKKLNHEAYYADVHKMSFHGGKMWIAPPQLIREEVRSFAII